LIGVTCDIGAHCELQLILFKRIAMEPSHYCPPRQSVFLSISSAKVCHLVRDGHETSLAETETRPRRWPHQPRRDICRSRDVTETLKCTLSCRSKQVNVGLTTVATVIACLLVSWCIPDFCAFNSSDYIQTVLYGTTACWCW